MIEGPHVKAWREKQEGQHRADWIELMRHPWGRRLLLDFIESIRYCGAYRSTYSVDQSIQSYMNGQRDVGLALFRAAQEADFEMFDRMIGEQTNQRRQFLLAQKSDGEKT